MSTTFTPGPWKINRAGDYSGDPSNMQILSITAANGKTMLFTDSGYFQPEEANARLIAAAPQLYEALQMAIWYYDSFRDSTPKGPTEIDDINSARAALAAAEGK